MLSIAAFSCVIDEGNPSMWSRPDAAVSFLDVAALGSCQFTDAGTTETPIVHVLSDHTFRLLVTLKLKDVEHGQVRAQVEPLRAGADKATFPLSQGKDGWEGKTIITVPEEGEYAFVVRVADIEQTVRVRVVSVAPDLTIAVFKPSGELWSIEVHTECNSKPLANQAITVESLPKAELLPSGGLTTDAQGKAHLTVKVPASKLPTRIDVASGKVRKGCTLLANEKVVDGDCTLAP